MRNSFTAIFTMPQSTAATLATPDACTADALFRPVPVGVQVDGVCPFCGHWHTVANRDGLPSCHVIGSTRRTAFRTTGGVQ